MRIYLAGPISADQQRTEYMHREHFTEKCNELRALGHTVYNPAENEPPNKTWEWYLAYDIDWIYKHHTELDAIYLMSLWKNSRGAKLEKEVGINLGLTIIEESCRT